MKKFRLLPDDFNVKLESGEYILIDVRTPEEKVMFGYIENTDYFFDMYRPEFITQVGKLDKTKKYLVYCFHGNRTQSVLAYMQDNLFEEVYDLIGGIEYWENYGYELIKD